MCVDGRAKVGCSDNVVDVARDFSRSDDRVEPVDRESVVRKNPKGRGPLNEKGTENDEGNDDCGYHCCEMGEGNRRGLHSGGEGAAPCINKNVHNCQEQWASVFVSENCI